MTDFIVSPIIIFLNVTVLQGCNYAPVGEVCAPQYDMPHWYTGEPVTMSRSYAVELCGRGTFSSTSTSYSYRQTDCEERTNYRPHIKSIIARPNEYYLPNGGTIKLFYTDVPANLSGVKNSYADMYTALGCNTSPCGMYNGVYEE